jgi:hypothetical protein
VPFQARLILIPGNNEHVFFYCLCAGDRAGQGRHERLNDRAQQNNVRLIFDNFIATVTMCFFPPPGFFLCQMTEQDWSS